MNQPTTDAIGIASALGGGVTAVQGETGFLDKLSDYATLYGMVFTAATFGIYAMTCYYRNKREALESAAVIASLRKPQKDQ